MKSFLGRFFLLRKMYVNFMYFTYFCHHTICNYFNCTYSYVVMLQHIQLFYKGPRLSPLKCLRTNNEFTFKVLTTLFLLCEYNI